MQQRAEVPAAARIDEPTFHLPSPRTQRSPSVSSPTNRLPVQVVTDVPHFLEVEWCNHLVLSEFLANQNSTSTQSTPGPSHGQSVPPDDSQTFPSFGVSSDGSACSSMTSDTADSDATDRHKDMAFT
jgi:hypothetical protein